MDEALPRVSQLALPRVSQLALPSHIYNIGLLTGQMYLIGAIVAYNYNYPNMIFVCSAIYATTMAHWYKIKSSGIAKTVDMCVVVSGILYISLHESYKFPGNGRKIWNSAILIIIMCYIFNAVILHFQSNGNDVCTQDQYEYFSLSTIPLNSPNIEKMYLYNTVIHTFFLHILPMTIGIYCAINT